MLTSSSNNKKIGLVLSGGGAKGAYQIGCWKSLRRAGYTNWGGLAGTSVGAMNAVLIASGRFEDTESAWREVRFREIFGIKPHRLVWFPVGVIASLLLELLRSKMRKVSISGLILKQRFSLVQSSLFTGDLSAFWSLCGLVGLASLALFFNGVRQAFLRWFSAAKNPLRALLDRAVAEADIETIKRAGTPVYATLSRYHAGTGWVPQYSRLDKLGKGGVLNILLESAGFTGIRPIRHFFGPYPVDGKWADNLPAAPLLFDPEVHVDVIFVLDISKRACPAGRFKRLSSILGKPFRALLGCENREKQDLLTQANQRWHAYNRYLFGQKGEGLAALPKNTDGSSTQLPQSLPVIVRVSPSQPLGSFFWFSRSKTKRLMELGEKDMDQVLAALQSQNHEAGAITEPQLCSFSVA
ncbi:MAG: patatin-like phospholipase family protein [Acidobacteria bacterium]|nr:patatin-like phospholipase family protein [Acidobacteriota bacterium]